MSWIFGGLSSLGFVTFALCPVVYLTRIFSGARNRAPIVLVTFYAQMVSFLSLYFSLNWVVVPRFQSLFEMLALDLGWLTRSVIRQSIILRSGPGLVLSLIAVVVLVRGTGRVLQKRWRDAAYPSGWIDQLGLMFWAAFATLVGSIVLGLYLPIHGLGKRPEPGPGAPIIRPRPVDPCATTMAGPFVAELLR